MTKTIAIVLALMNGAWMIFDGVHVQRYGKYFGPDIPGPWRHLVEAVGLNPLRIGPAFIGLGILWLAGALLAKLGFTENALLAAAILSLWYLPVGTVISVAVLALLLIPRLL